MERVDNEQSMLLELCTLSARSVDGVAWPMSLASFRHPADDEEFCLHDGSD